MTDEKSNKINVVNFSEKYEEKQNEKVTKEVMERLDIDEDELKQTISALTGEDIESSDFQGAIADAVERNKLYAAWCKRKEKEDIEKGYDPQQCHCAVCPHHVTSEFQEVKTEYDDDGNPIAGYIENQGRQDYCGNDEAQDCLYRMKEPPVSELSFNTDIPSYREALDILQRNDLLEPDEFGKYNGTDFAFHKSTAKLWFSFCKLIGEIQGYDWEEPIEKSDSIHTAKTCFKKMMNDVHGKKWDSMERNLKSSLDYILMSCGNTCYDELSEDQKESFEYVFSEIRNTMRGLTISNTLLEDSIQRFKKE